MTKIRGWLIVALIGAVLPPAAMAFADTRTEHKDYYVGSDLDPVCTYADVPYELRNDQRIGGACFDLLGNEVTVDVSVEDLTGLPIGSALGFETESGTTIGQLTPFCGEIYGAEVPSGAAKMVAYVAGPLAGPVFCVVENKVGSGGTAGTIHVTYQLGDQTGFPPIDEERDCLEFVPETAGVTGVTDAGQTVNLSVMVILDQAPSLVTTQRGQEVFAKAAESYAPLNINLTSSFVTHTFAGNVAQGIINQAKNLVGGQRPAGSDIVYVLTNKNIEQSPVGSNVVGLADCVGGIRYPDRAFAVGEDIGDGFPVGPVTFYKNGAAKTAGHEIGHLMGAHHHYANCVEGASTIPEENGPSACTLMFNSLDFLSTKFGTLEGVIVRGHAVDFASP